MTAGVAMPIEAVKSIDKPFYLPSGDEVDIFTAAHRQRLPVLIKGPTGVGKTRFVESMAHRLGRDLITVSCHEDLTASDLVGRFLLEADRTIWFDGPLTRAVRTGAICYLDEVVEARQDTTVVLHALTDHRRILTLDRTSETLEAPPEFQIVMSYNPGYQSLLKDLKDSTRQRMVAIELDFPSEETELGVLRHETAIDDGTARVLVRIAAALRRSNFGLREVASTRTLVTAGKLIAAGIPVRSALWAAVGAPLSDDRGVAEGLKTLIDSYVDQ